MGINTVNLQNCLGRLSLLPVTGMDNEYSYGWVRAASDSSVGNSRQDYVRGINMPTYAYLRNVASSFDSVVLTIAIISVDY